MRINPHSLRAIRERSGLSQTQLAELVGVPPQYVNNVEAGRRGVSERKLAELADALKVPVAALLAEPQEQAS